MAMATVWSAISHQPWEGIIVVSGEQSSVGFAVKDWLLGTQAAPVCEAGALARGRLMTAGRSRRSYRARESTRAEVCPAASVVSGGARLSCRHGPKAVRDTRNVVENVGPGLYARPP